MESKKYWMNTAPPPVVVGSGLIALDVMINERRKEEPRLWTGGTCGNVLTILSYLGWHSLPVARLGRRDPGSRLIFRDLRHWKVDLRFASLPPSTPAPVIIHRLRRKLSGESFHSFSLNCPDCGKRLPSFTPIVNSAAIEVVPEIPKPDVAFFDRVSRGILALASGLANRGAIVVFEPIRIGDDSLFREMLQFTHILKYSHERLSDLEPSWTLKVPLVIETLGEEGLRYKSKLPKAATKKWRSFNALPVSRNVDTAGAGDWCTAGILHAIGRNGWNGLKQLSSGSLTSALSFAQGLAAWNCGFEGARGGMYEKDFHTFRKEVDEILRHTRTGIDRLHEDGSIPEQVIVQVCSDCRNKAKKPVIHRLLHVG